MSKVIVYTDGSCNPSKDGGFAVVIITKKCYNEGKCYCISQGFTETTNNKMELSAYIRAVEYIIKKGSVKDAIVYCDSTYVLNGVRDWMYSWKSAGWKTYTGKELKNKELWQKAYSLTQKAKKIGLKLELRKVKAHSGNTFNEIADKNAKLISGKEIETKKIIKF